MNPPYQDHTPVLVADQPWEGLIGGYGTVIKEGDRFRMWYHAFRMTHPVDAAVPHTYEGQKKFFSKYPYLQFICYAESVDGVDWQKPDLGLYEYEGSRKNNIVIDPGPDCRRRHHGGCVFIDPSAQDSERYKMWAPLQEILSPDDAIPAAMDGLRRFHSADGIHWTMYEPDTPNPPGNYDSFNSVFWDVRLKRYVGFKRNWAQDDQGDGYRAIVRWESPDFHTWQEIGEIKLSDEADQSVEVNRKRPSPIFDWYTPPVIQHPGNRDLYLMFPSAYWHWGEGVFPGRNMLHKGGFPDRLDTQLAVSRDGIAWTRAGGRHPLLRLGFTGQVDSGCIYAIPDLVEVDRETWVYYHGNSDEHGGAWWEHRHGIFRARIRRDGFCSADASYQGGELFTIPFTFEGDTLELNADTSAGGVIRVEILDADRAPIQGFTLADADELNGNDVRMRATWCGSSSLARLAGSAIRLRLVMRDTKLFSFQTAGACAEPSLPG